MKKGDKIVGIVLIIVVLISFGGVSIYKALLKGSENIAVIKREGKVIKTIDLNKVTGFAARDSPALPKLQAAVRKLPGFSRRCCSSPGPGTSPARSQTHTGRR